eukprot:scaffold544192_cov28-Prasinocladus_malaysianus.AAC.1
MATQNPLKDHFNASSTRAAMARFIWLVTKVSIGYTTASTLRAGQAKFIEYHRKRCATTLSLRARRSYLADRCVDAEDWVGHAALEVGVEAVGVVEQDGRLHVLGPVAGREGEVEVLLAGLQHDGDHVGRHAQREDVHAVDDVVHRGLEGLHAADAQLDGEDGRLVRGDAHGQLLRAVMPQLPDQSVRRYFQHQIITNARGCKVPIASSYQSQTFDLDVLSSNNEISNS